jgi:hypothetical protein
VHSLRTEICAFAFYGLGGADDRRLTIVSPIRVRTQVSGFNCPPALAVKQAKIEAQAVSS